MRTAKQQSPIEATVIICPGVLGHREKSLLPGKPDLDRARDPLNQAGHPNGFDTVVATKIVAEYSSAAQIVRAHLAKVGINVEVAPDPSWHAAWFVPEQAREWNRERWNTADFGASH